MIKIMLSLLPVFFLSAHLFGSADTCGETDAEFIMITDSDGFNIESYNCLIGSMEDATAEDEISVCGFGEIPTVWFEVSVDDIAQLMYVNVTTDGSWDPVFSIFGGTCPDGLIQLEGENKPGCNREWSNSVQLNQSIV